MTNRLPDWLGDEALAPLWDAAAKRLERSSLEPTGAIRLAGLDRTTRHALSDLLGRTIVADQVRVDLSELDLSLRQRSGIGGVRTVVEAALGRRLRDRSAERSTAAAVREAPYAAAREWLDAHPLVAAADWPEQWLSSVRRSGVLRRLTAPQGDVLRALRLTSDRVADPAPVARNDLAVRYTRDAHGLDDGRPLSQLALRAFAIAEGVERPTTGAGRRALWERFGVAADSVSSTCLVLGLRPVADGVREQRLQGAADAGDPVQLTGWDVDRLRLPVEARTRVLVCENPRILEGFAQHRGGTVPIVCVAGEPNLVTLRVLRDLSAGGAVLEYHGDFDWPGIAIANRLVASLGVEPWRMSAGDYRSAVAADGPTLVPPVVVPCWDPALGSAMVDHGVAVHEEAVLDALLGDR